MESNKKIESVIIIGAGLGGLLLAKSLKKNAPSIKVTVYERDASETYRSQGYQIGLNPDGIRSLQSVDLPHLPELLTRNSAFKFAMVDTAHKVLAVVGGGKEADGTPSMAIVNRWTVRELLTEGIEIHYNKRFTKYEEHDDQVVAHFEDGTTATADILVGADGSRSRVRAQRCPSLVYEELPVQSCFAYCPLPDNIPKISEMLKDSCVRIISPQGIAVLIIKFKDDQGKENIVWGMSEPSPIGKALPGSTAEIRKHLEEIADMWHNTELRTIIDSTSDETFIPPSKLHAIRIVDGNPLGKPTRVTLLGDAAHAMTTHRGLGANTAFQDAIDLSKALASEDWYAGLVKYEPEMFKRGFKNAKDSLNSTNMLHCTGWKAYLRDTIVSAIGWGIWAYKKITSS